VLKEENNEKSEKQTTKITQLNKQIQELKKKNLEEKLELKT
jgi:hypothetical protein